MKKAIISIPKLALLTLLSLNSFAFSEYSTSDSTVIKFRSEDESVSTVKIELYRYYFPKSLPQVVIGKQFGTDFVFQLGRLEKPVYVNLYYTLPNKRSVVKILKMYLVEPGDNVSVIKIRSKGDEQALMSPNSRLLQFAGKGIEKYNCRYEFEKAVYNIKSSMRVVDEGGEFISGNYFDEYKTITNLILKSYKSKLSKQAYDILKVDLFSSIEIQRLKFLAIHFTFSDTALLKRIINNYQQLISEEERQLTNKARCISFIYPQYVLDKFSIGKYKSALSKSWKDTSIRQVYSDIKNSSTLIRELKDKVLTYLALNLYFSSKKGNEMFEEIKSVVNTKYCLNILELFHKQNAVGKEAFDFSLPDVSGNYRKLSEFKGKVVFIDFWFNGCGGCAQYFNKVVSTVEKEFKSNDSVVFISINVDADRMRWIKGIESKMYTNNETINLYTEGKGVNHPVVMNYRVTAYPRPILIGKDGSIFCNNYDELRRGGAKKVIDLIRQALQYQYMSPHIFSGTE